MKRLALIPLGLALVLAACERTPGNENPIAGPAPVVTTQLHGTLAIAGDTVRLVKESQAVRLVNVNARIVASFEGLPVVAAGYYQSVGFYVTDLREDVTPTKPIPYL